MLRVGSFRDGLNHEAIIDPEGNILVCKTLDDREGTLNLDTAVFIHRVERYSPRDLVALNGQITSAFREVVEAASQ